MSIKKLQLSYLRTVINFKIDVFICCASYEERCRSISNLLDPDSIGVAWVAKNENLLPLVEANFSLLTSRFKKHLPVLLDSSDPILTADSIQLAFTSSENKIIGKTFLVDVTTFTHESLLILFQLILLNTTQEDSVFLVYTSASDYNSEETDREKVWLSKGVEDVRSVLGYAGEMLPSKKTHLIILVGYEVERASKLIEVFEPNKISLGHGKLGTHTHEKHQSTNEYFAKLVKETAFKYGEVAEFEFSCNDPLSAKASILEYVKKTEKFNCVIAPMNTKLTTIAAALVARDNPSVQLCYASPRTYNHRNYSTPGENFYFLNLRDIL